MPPRHSTLISLLQYICLYYTVLYYTTPLPPPCLPLATTQAASDEYSWSIDLGECARIWKGGCIIRAGLLDRIKTA